MLLGKMYTGGNHVRNSYEGNNGFVSLLRVFFF